MVFESTRSAKDMNFQKFCGYIPQGLSIVMEDADGKYLEWCKCKSFFRNFSEPGGSGYDIMEKSDCEGAEQLQR